MVSILPVMERHSGGCEHQCHGRTGQQKEPGCLRPPQCKSSRSSRRRTGAHRFDSPLAGQHDAPAPLPLASCIKQEPRARGAGFFRSCP